MPTGKNSSNEAQTDSEQEGRKLAQVYVYPKHREDIKSLLGAINNGAGGGSVSRSQLFRWLYQMMKSAEKKIHFDKIMDERSFKKEVLNALRKADTEDVISKVSDSQKYVK